MRAKSLFKSLEWECLFANCNKCFALFFQDSSCTVVGPYGEFSKSVSHEGGKSTSKATCKKRGERRGDIVVAKKAAKKNPCSFL